MISQDVLTIYAIPKENLPAINESSTSIEKISSVVEGYNKYFRRYKMVGQYPLKDLPNLLQNLDTKIKEFGLEKDGRVCARIFIPNIKSENLNALNLICSNRGYEVEYLYDHTFNEKTGCIALIGKNSPNRPVLDNKVNDSKILRKLSRSKNIQALESSEVETSFKFADPFSLSEGQVDELVMNWKLFFGPYYEKEVVIELLKDNNVVKVIILNDQGEVRAACIGEPDNLGGIEITEFFSLETNLSVILLRRAINDCKSKYPDYKIFLEANASSAAAYLALKAGMSVAGTNNLNTPHIAKAHAKVNQASSDQLGYNNFIVFTYEEDKKDNFS